MGVRNYEAKQGAIPGVDTMTNLETGAIVYDKETDKEIPNPAVVRTIHDIHANKYFIKEIGMTVAEANPEYSPYERVVSVEFWPSYTAGEGRMYAYPEGRLEVIDDMWSWFDEMIPNGLKPQLKPRFNEFLTAVRMKYETYSIAGNYVLES